MDVRDYKDLETLLSGIQHPLEHIAGALAELNANAEAIMANGATVTIAIKIGGNPDE